MKLNDWQMGAVAGLVIGLLMYARGPIDNAEAVVQQAGLIAGTTVGLTIVGLIVGFVGRLFRRKA